MRVGVRVGVLEGLGYITISKARVRVVVKVRVWVELWLGFG